MDLIGWILVIVVAVCVILLVMIDKKRRELRDMMYYERESESEEFIVKDRSKPPAKPKSDSEEAYPTSTIKSKQMTIYEYQCWTRTRVCRQCDGESAINADRCGICGMPF